MYTAYDYICSNRSLNDIDREISGGYVHVHMSNQKPMRPSFQVKNVGISSRIFSLRLSGVGCQCSPCILHLSPLGTGFSPQLYGICGILLVDCWSVY